MVRRLFLPVETCRGASPKKPEKPVNETYHHKSQMRRAAVRLSVVQYRILFESNNIGFI